MDYLTDFINFMESLDDIPRNEAIFDSMPKIISVLKKMLNMAIYYRNGRYTIPEGQTVSTMYAERRRTGNELFYIADDEIDGVIKLIFNNNLKKGNPENQIIIQGPYSIPCIKINRLDAAVQAGTIYYIESIRRFIIPINIPGIGTIKLIGNIGTVYNNVIISRVNKCGNKNCSKTCQFYHNPLKYPKRDPEIRNFSIHSWQGQHGKNTGQKIYRKVFSNDHIVDNIETVNEEDLIFYSEQLMHDLLCLILMARYRASPFNE